MAVREGELAFIDDCQGKFQMMAKVSRERPAKAWRRGAGTKIFDWWVLR